MRLVVVGASLAGLRAVEAARRAGHTGEIVLVGAEEHLPYDRPPLSKAYLDADSDGEATVFRDEASFRDELDVDVRLGVAATGLDIEGRTLHLGEDSLDYDALVIATGASPRPFPGADELVGVAALRSLDDARTIRTALDQQQRIVVIGAGLIGSEVAAAARKRDLPITVVEAADLPLTRSIGPDAGLACAELHRAMGVDLRLGTGVDALESEDGRVTGVRLSDGQVLPADLVVAATGVLPSTAWLAGSGVTLHERDGGIVTDAALKAADGVWAAGDVLHTRLENWTAAASQGAAAAKHAIGEDPTDWDDVAFFWSDWYDRRIQMLGTADADEVRVIHPGDTGDDVARGFLALYRRGDHVVGALSIDRPRDIMKFRRRIADAGAWDEAVAFAVERVGLAS
ncbi:NAD(P)/FAD-dependent oxidoreductase [Aeromicrobium sp. CF3.5]|uniref:NAD(P)/FAD-dependent oxidoreductase n=1 Tax=Aeromicrobium sp. CF3.5 TaxID=3373078 RepID=UPI003EE7EA9B